MKFKNSWNLFKFFCILLLSAFGYEFIFFIMTLHIYDLSKSALNIGVFTALTFVPKLFSSLLGGIADKYKKGWCFAFSAAAVSSLLFLISFVTDISQIYLVWFISSIFFTFIINVRSALMAELISKEQYTFGNALVLSLLNAAKLLGPLLGGFILTLCTIKSLLYFTCAVYLLAAVFAAYIRTSDAQNNNKKSLFLNIKKGFLFMTENPTFRMLALISFFWRLFLGLQLSLFVVYIKSALLGTSKEYGSFMATIGIGSIAGSLLGPYIAKHLSSSKLIFLGLSLHYISFGALGLCTHYYLSLGIGFFSYMVFYMTLVGIHTLRDQVTQFEIRSSAYGTVTAFLTPPAIISMLVGSYLADLFGVTFVLLGAGLCALLSLNIILYFGWNKRCHKENGIQKRF